MDVTSRQEWQERLEALSSLEHNEGYQFLMQWVDDQGRGKFAQLMQSSDSLQMAKLVGAVGAYREVRAQVSSAIKAIQESLNTQE